MDNKLNDQQINVYSEQVAEKLISSFFENKEKISGEEVLNFSAIKQVNLFILKGLFQNWKNESKKLESPYFDYSHPDVVEAIERFKNTVSRHILVEKKFFEPILKTAISNTLMLICSPYHFYLNELNAISADGLVVLEGLQELKKFTRVNQSILDGLIANLSKSTPDINGLDAIKVLDEVIENLSSSPEDMDLYIEAFSNYVPLNINDIYLEVEDLSEPAKLEAQSANISNEQPEMSKEDLSEFTLNESFASEDQMSLADLHEKQKIESLSRGITLNQRFMFVNVLFDGDVAKFNNTVLEMDGLPDLAEAKNYVSKRFSHWNIASYEVEEFMSILERRFS